MAEEPLSKFVQGLLTIAWRTVFDATKGLYLPDVLCKQFDPIVYAGPSGELEVPLDTIGDADAACMSPTFTELAIATALPRIDLMRLFIRNLWAIAPKTDTLSFSTVAPEFTATLLTGKLRGVAKPFTIEADGTKTNFRFALACCFSAEDDENARTCKGAGWITRAEGRLKATVKKAELQITFRASFGDNLKITVRHIVVKLDQSDVDVDFVIDGFDPDDKGAVMAAIAMALATGPVNEVLQDFLDSSKFRDQLGALITEEINKVLEIR